MRSWVLSVGLMASVFGEADLALGEIRCLRSGSQPDGRPPGGEVVDGAATAVSCSDPVVDETRTLAGLGLFVLRLSVGASCP